MGKKMFEGTLGAQPRRRVEARAKLALILVGALACLTPGLAQAQSPPHVEWEVYNRFRFYKNPQIFRDYLNVAKETAASGTVEWVLNTENALEKKADNEKAGWAANNLGPQDLCWNRATLRYDSCGTEADYVLPSAITILARLAGAPAFETATCAWTLEAPQVGPTTIGGPCAGTKIDTPFAADAMDAPKLSVVVQSGGAGPVPPIAPETIRVRDYLIVGMGDSFGAGVGNPDIPARMASNGQNAISYFTVGFIPFDHHPPDDPRRFYLPVREGLGAAGGGPGQAQWLDVRCFRSQYGPQFRAALHLAAALQHDSVTFLDFSCSGATVLQGLLSSKPLDMGFAPAIGPVPSQVAEVASLVCDRLTTDWSRVVAYLDHDHFRPDACDQNVLCEYRSGGGREHPRRTNKGAQVQRPPGVDIKGCGQDGYRRQIDYVMLSIGGNDIGFAPLVAQEALRGGTLDYDVLRGILQDLLGDIEDGTTAANRLDYLQDIYFHLNDALAKTLPIRGQDLSRVLLAGYPLPDGWGGNGLCGDNVEGSLRANDSMDGVDVLGGFSDGGVAAKKSIVEDVHQAACKLNVRRGAWMNGSLDPDRQASETWMAQGPCVGSGTGVVGPAPTLHWSYVMGFVEKSWAHGFCAVAGDAKQACVRDPSSTLCAAEIAKIPGFADRSAGEPSAPYPVAAFQPYQSRERWFRTFNDAYLTTNWQATQKASDVYNAISTFSTSAMHPTAQGYAAIADSFVRAIGTDLCKRGEVDDAGRAIVNLCSP
jgi:hypothetical protein